MTKQLDTDVLDSAQAIRELENENAQLKGALEESRFMHSELLARYADVHGQLRRYQLHEEQQRRIHEEQVRAQMQMYQNLGQMQAQALGNQAAAQNLHSAMNHLVEGVERHCNCIPDRSSFLRFFGG